MVEELAPVAPPCFNDRLSWLEYLTSAAHAQTEKDQPAPLIFEAGKEVRFNYAFDWCVDCEPLFRRQMSACQRCRPDWLRAHEQPLTLQQLVEIARV